MFDNTVLPVFELYIFEIVKKLFEQLQIESSVQHLEIPDVSNTIMPTRFRGLFSSKTKGLARFIAEQSGSRNHLKIVYAKRTIG